jgi:hypothetical protein
MLYNLTFPLRLPAFDYHFYITNIFFYQKNYKNRVKIMMICSNKNNKE